MKTPTQPLEETEIPAPRLTDEQIAAIADDDSREILQLARKLGIQKAEVPFSGCGDEGTIEKADVGVSTQAFDPETSKYIPNPAYTEEHMRLEGLLDAEAESVVEQSDVNWYDGEGGGGEVVFDFETGKITLNIHQYEVVACDEQVFDFSLVAKEEE